MNVVSLSPKKASDVAGRRDSRLTIMISWVDGAIGGDTIQRFCAALATTVNLFAHVGGLTNIERTILRKRDLLTLIHRARQNSK
jgi:hypothetical protein